MHCERIIVVRCWIVRTLEEFILIHYDWKKYYLIFLSKQMLLTGIYFTVQTKVYANFNTVN